MSPIDFWQNVTKLFGAAATCVGQRLTIYGDPLKNQYGLKNEDDLENEDSLKYQPSNAGSTRSPSEMLQHLQNQKLPPGGPKMADRVWRSNPRLLGTPNNFC